MKTHGLVVAALGALAVVAGDSVRIEEMLAAACAPGGAREVTLGRNPARPDGKWLLDRAILLPDDFTLTIDDCTVELGPGVRDNLIRNVGAVPNAIATNRNIRVRGRGHAVLSGGDGVHFDPPGDKMGWRTIGILFCAVEGFTIEKLTIRESHAWGISVEHGAKNGRIADITFEDTNRYPNQDGIDVRKGAHDIVIENISGTVGDDAVALTGIRRPTRLPPETPLPNTPEEAAKLFANKRKLSMQIGGDGVREGDDIHNVEIRHVHARCRGGHGIIRLLCQGGVKMHHVKVEDVVDMAGPGDPRAQATIRIGDSYNWSAQRDQQGDMHHIDVRNVTAKGKVGVWIKGALADSAVKDIRVPAGTKKYDVTAPLTRVELDDQAPEPKDVPALLTTAKGEKVTTVEQWEKVRAPELLATFTREEYGRRPVERPPELRFETAEPDAVMMGGKALRKRIRVCYGGKYGKGSFVLTAFIPRQEKPAPAFVLICNRTASENIDPTRERKSGFWPAEEIVARGYAAIAFWNGDIAPDWNTGNREGVFACFEPAGARHGSALWGTLSAWAWGASRVMDWIETEPLLDAKHVGVVGHSRGGKTALVAGVYDRRFAMACSNCSGCSGAKLNHVDLPKSEHIAQIVRNFPYWFCQNYFAHANLDERLPFDQHQFVALMAPRLVAIASASEDAWAGQPGEYWCGRLASPAWELYGRKGLVSDGFPPPEKPLQDGCISYHLRTGKHNLTPYDWNCYMDFADRHGWR